MKLVFILRHSQAITNFLGSDFERELSEQGIEDSKKVAVQLKEQQILFDAVLCSSAKRTKQTLDHFMEALFIENSSIKYIDSLYHATETEIYKQLEQLSSSVNIVLVVTHNPGVTHFANSLQIVSLDNMPTTGILGFSADCITWEDLKNSKKEFLYFNYPQLA